MHLKKILGASLATLALTGVFALAAQANDESSNSNANTNTGEHMMTKSPVDLACMTSAVDKREAATVSAWNAFNTAMQSALSARTSALHTAWGMTDTKARRAAIRAAWSAFRKAKRTARMDYNKAVKSAWGTFRTDAKACHGSPGEEGGGQGQDNL